MIKFSGVLLNSTMALIGIQSIVLLWCVLKTSMMTLLLMTPKQSDNIIIRILSLITSNKLFNILNIFIK